jgi:hypothetical protein
VIGTAVLAFIHSQRLLTWAYGDATAAGAEYRQSMLTVGTFVAAVAAWVSSTVAGPTIAYVPLGSARRGAPLVATHLTFLLAACATGFTAGHAPTTLHVWATKVYGSFDVAAIASGYAALFAYVAFGYLIGCVTPRYFAVPIALGLTYVMAFFTSNIFSPIFDFDVISGLEVPSQVSIARGLFFLAAGGAAVLASSAWLRTRTLSEAGRPAAMVGAILLPVALLVYASASYSKPLVRLDDAKPVCQETASSQVCVHPARAELLPDLVASVNAMSEQAGPVIFPPSEFVDATVATGNSRTTYVLQLQGQREDWLAIARSDIAGYVAGVDACYRLNRPDQGSQDVSSAAAAWIAGLAGDAAPVLSSSPGSAEQLRRLNREGVAQARSGLEGDITGIRQCAGQAFE